MTYKKAKELLLKIIDETRPQSETLEKLRDLFDAGQKEIALYYYIYKTVNYNQEDAKSLPTDCYKALNVRCDMGEVPFVIQQGNIICQRESFELEYAAFPNSLPDKPQDDCVLQIQDEAIMALVLFVAAQLNNNDDSQGAFQSYWTQYQSKLQNLCVTSNGACAVVYGGGEI